MSIVVTLTLKAAEGQYEALAKVMQDILPDTAARPGAELIRAAGDPASGTIIVYEEWDCLESQQAYMAWRTERGDLNGIGPLLGAPPNFEQKTLLF